MAFLLLAASTLMHILCRFVFQVLISKPSLRVRQSHCQVKPSGCLDVGSPSRRPGVWALASPLQALLLVAMAAIQEDSFNAYVTVVRAIGLHPKLSERSRTMWRACIVLAPCMASRRACVSSNDDMCYLADCVVKFIPDGLSLFGNMAVLLHSLHSQG